MPNKHGDFIWYELLTNDATAAQEFYGKVLGWKMTDSGQTEMDYSILQATNIDGAHQIGGLMQITDDMKANGAHPIWLGYIGVNDVDDSITQIVAAGGSIRMPAADIPNVGRIAMVTDPQGTPFYVMRGASNDETSLAFAFDRPRIGHCAWNELSTTDPAAARQFYGEVFGWSKDGELDMGPMGSYEFLRQSGANGGMLGALMPKPAVMSMPMWRYYFRVADIDDAVEKVVAAKGQILSGPDEIPGNEFTIIGIDPQGASFALVGARKS